MYARVNIIFGQRDKVDDGIAQRQVDLDLGIALLQHGLGPLARLCAGTEEEDGQSLVRAASEERLEEVAARHLAVERQPEEPRHRHERHAVGQGEKAPAVGADERLRALSHGDVVDVRREHEAVQRPVRHAGAQAALRPRHDEVDRLVVLDTMREHSPKANAP